MGEDDVRATLRRLTPEPELHIDVERVRRGARRRRTRLRSAVAVAGCLVAALGYVAVISSEPSEQRSADSPIDRSPTEPAITPSPQGWRPIASSPLAPRHDAIGAWTGQELVVVGGRTGRPCPPNANCAILPATAEAAAYDPVRDAWRILPNAPSAVASGRAVWTGAELVVIAGADTLALDPATERWRVLDDLPLLGKLQPLVVADGDVIAIAYQQNGEVDVDWRLDLASGQWSALPHDPFGESYDRSMAWDSERLWLLSMSGEHHYGAYEGAPSRVAVLEGEEWTILDEATPALGYEQNWWFADGALIAPATFDSAPSRVFDVASRTWEEVTQRSSADGCPVSAAGPGPDWVSGGGALLVSADPLQAVVVPECPELPAPSVAAWAGRHLIVWGGPAPGYDGNTDAGLLWTPPTPGE